MGFLNLSGILNVLADSYTVSCLVNSRDSEKSIHHWFVSMRMKKTRKLTKGKYRLEKNETSIKVEISIFRINKYLQVIDNTSNYKLDLKTDRTILKTSH